MSNRLLLLGATSGWGHMQAAYNIENALNEMAPSIPLRAECINVFQYSPLPAELLLSGGWEIASRLFPELYSRFHKLIMRGGWGNKLLFPFALRAAARIM